MFFIAAREDIQLVMNEMQKARRPGAARRHRGRRQHRLPVWRSGWKSSTRSKLIERDQRRAPAHLGTAEQHHRAERRCRGRRAAARREHRQRRLSSSRVTNAEEANILSAMLAKRLGCHKVMALINRACVRRADGERLDRRRARRRSRSRSARCSRTSGAAMWCACTRCGVERGEAIEAIAHGIQGESARHRRTDRRHPSARGHHDQRHRARRRSADHRPPRHSDPRATIT